MENRSKISALAFVAAVSFAAPARADISTGDLMYTDFFRWPDWRENLAHFDCTPQMFVFMWTVPPDPLPDVVPDVVVAPCVIDCDGPPPCFDCGPGTPTAPVPETSTWIMGMIGFAFLAFPIFRQRLATVSKWKVR